MSDQHQFGDDTLHEKTVTWARVDLERLVHLEEKVDELESKLDKRAVVDISFPALAALILLFVSTVAVAVLVGR